MLEKSLRVVVLKDREFNSLSRLCSFCQNFKKYIYITFLAQAHNLNRIFTWKHKYKGNAPQIGLVR